MTQVGVRVLLRVQTKVEVQVVCGSHACQTPTYKQIVAEHQCRQYCQAENQVSLLLE
jgi:hypothetical protein